MRRRGKDLFLKEKTGTEAVGTRPIAKVYQARTEVNGFAANEPRRLPCGDGKWVNSRNVELESRGVPLGVGQDRNVSGSDTRRVLEGTRWNAEQGRRRVTEKPCPGGGLDNYE